MNSFVKFVLLFHLLLGVFQAALCKGGQQWIFPKESEEVIFKCLTGENFKDVVLTSTNPWVVVLSDGELNGGWQQLAKYWRGAILVANVEERHQADVLKAMRLKEDTKDELLTLQQSGPSGVAIIFPLGCPNAKLHKLNFTNDPTDALAMVLKGLPAEETPVSNQETLGKFLSANVNRRVPVFAVINHSPKWIASDMFLALYRVVAYTFKDHFSFGLFTTEDDTYRPFFNAQAGSSTSQKIPGLVAIAARASSNTHAQIQGFMLQEEKFGSISFYSIVNWLFEASDRFGISFANEKDSSEKSRGMVELMENIFKELEKFSKCQETENVRREEL